MNKLKRVATALVVTAACNVAAAQEFPTRPIRFVIGPAPDLLARLIGQRLTETRGQPVVIDQRTGAGGIIAAETAAKAAADGYTWLMSSGAYLTIAGLYPKLPYDFMADFAPVTLMASLPWILVVNPGVAAKTVDEFVQLARARPGQLNYGNSGNGTTTHLVTEMFKNDAKINLVNIPYKGVVPAVTDLMAGQVQVMFAIAQAGVPHVLSGKLRALAVTSPKRSAALPEVPTLSESGFKGMVVVGWNGIHVPAQTPRATINRINESINEVLAMRDIQERMTAAGFDPEKTTVPEFDKFVKDDLARYLKVIRESNVRID